MKMNQTVDQASREWVQLDNFGGSELHDRSTPGSIVLLFCTLITFTVPLTTPIDSTVIAQPPSSSTALDKLSASLKEVTNQSRHSIVTIARSVTPSNSAVPLPSDSEFNPSEFTTGIVISNTGHILTAYHTLGQPDKNSYFIFGQPKTAENASWIGEASIHAADPWMDLAVLKIDGVDLVKTNVSKIDDQDLPSIAYMLQASASYTTNHQFASQIIVLNESRNIVNKADLPNKTKVANRYEHGGLLIAVPAARPASGNVVLDEKGSLLGISTLRIPTSAFIPGAACIMPTDTTFVTALESLIAGMPTNPPLLGISFENIKSTTNADTELGVLVNRVGTATPALFSGLKPSDRVIAINSINVESNAHAQELIARSFAGDKTSISVVRQGNATIMLFNLTLAKRFNQHVQPPIASVDPYRFEGITVEFVTASSPADFRRYAADIPQSGAVLTDAVELDSPAWNAGIRAGMLIATVNNKPCTSPFEFRQITESLSDTPADLDVIQSGKRLTISIQR